MNKLPWLRQPEVLLSAEQGSENSMEGDGSDTSGGMENVLVEGEVSGVHSGAGGSESDGASDDMGYPVEVRVDTIAPLTV